MSPSSLKELQLDKLNRQLARLYDKSAFYNELYSSAGVDPGKLRLNSLEDLQHFPFVTKQAIRDEQASHPFFGRISTVPQSDCCVTHSSSGTTGRAYHGLWSRNDHEYVIEVITRCLWTMGLRPGDVVQNAFAYGLFVAGLFVHHACMRLGCLVVPVGATATEKQLDYLTNLKSDVLVSTPSFATYLTERLSEAGLDSSALKLRLGCFGGEPGAAVPATRNLIESRLNLKCRDFYGLAEICPGMAGECEQQNGTHFCEDHLIIEVVDPQTKAPVEEGEIGVAVYTDLTREATPLVRYWTNDLVRISREPCKCGRTHARMVGGILGRADDQINLKGAKFYPTQIEQIVRSFEELGSEFRVVLDRDTQRQLDFGVIQVELVAAVEQEPLRQRLMHSLREATQCRLEVEFLGSGEFPRSETKTKRVIDKRPNRN